MSLYGGYPDKFDEERNIVSPSARSGARVVRMDRYARRQRELRSSVHHDQADVDRDDPVRHGDGYARTAVSKVLVGERLSGDQGRERESFDHRGRRRGAGAHWRCRDVPRPDRPEVT
jgi:hypothetical protein